jgi:hypothetical protein
MYLEGVIVCVNYSDFLAHTLPHNKIHFDRLVVVTDRNDTDTLKLCEYHHVECIQTDSFYAEGADFNKAKGINVGLNRLSRKGFVMHLDADIYLPPLTRRILENIELDPQYIYGVDRMMCPTYADWMQFLEKPSLTHEGWIYIHPTIFPLGVRIAEYMNKGYEPIGFLQLWNPIASKVFWYPEEHGAADRTDVLFAKKWPRAKRGLIPEIIVIHLDSENLNLKEMGKNWNGRKTSPFHFPPIEETITSYKKPNFWTIICRKIFRKR